ncbi:hypothetical protein [uncultured Anaerococcus sp.]|uniref:hypothetical protein n=1 Tax=uncultured Anaerococcus sp. TaxID=293428 RepID=UPI00288B98DF|nr:hypothetical protein [uncultured Anaerococcus sp.]
MASDSGNSNLKKYIEYLKSRFNDSEFIPTIVDTTLRTANENACRIINLDKSYYIQKGESPLAIFHLNIDSLTDVEFNFSETDDGETIVSEVINNLIVSAIVINYLLINSEASFDILLTYSNIQSQLEDYSEISDIIRTNNIVNLNLRQADALADEFSSLLLSLITVPINRVKPEFAYKTYKLSLASLMGGHAGDNVNKLRKNSIKMIIGFFRKLKSKVDLEMISISGGDRYDTIPSFADIEFIVNADFENELINAFEIYKNEVIEKNLRYEPDMKLTCEEIDNKNIDPISIESFNHLASFVELCPSGTFAVNSLDNQVISSSNLATTRTLKQSINMILVFRSLTQEGMRQMLEKSNIAAKIAKSYLDEKLLIPSFKNSDKSLTNVFQKSYKDLYNEDLDVIKSQYSLDSSIVFKNQNVKMVSLGVKYKQDNQKYYIHIDDILRVINLLENVLDKLKENKEKL